MGGDLHIVLWAPRSAAERLAELAVRRIELLESGWSRFRPGSELNRLNARAGQGDVEVSEDLRRLVVVCSDAYAWSGGDVDATVLGSMVAMGYADDFTRVATALPGTWIPRPAAGMDGVRIGPRTVSLPAGAGLDPGGVGKGLAGEIVTAEIADAGAGAVLVSLGGDVVTRGTPPGADCWRISMRDDRLDAPTEIRVVELRGANRAVATSSTLRRRWAGRHHVVDPRTGRPADSDIVQATVVADCGWRAEAAATVALIRGSGCVGWLAGLGCTAYLLGRAVPSV
jgi:thiamine biosynthesis lipoprotein